jgi:hypothetical protein
MRSVLFNGTLLIENWRGRTGNVRVEKLAANQVVLVNINNFKKGKVFENGVLVTGENKANALLEKRKKLVDKRCILLVMLWKL